MIKSELPRQVNILTIEPIEQDKNEFNVLVRFEHIYDRNEHSKYSQSVSFKLNVNIISNLCFSLFSSLKTIFKQHQIIDAQETSLAGNILKSETFERLKWTEKSTTSKQTSFDGQTITLNPMEIRSFLIKLKN